MIPKVLLSVGLLFVWGCGNGNYCCDFNGNCDPFCALRNETGRAASAQGPNREYMIVLTRSRSECSFAPQSLADTVTIARTRDKFIVMLGNAGRLSGRIKRKRATARGSLAVALAGCHAEGTLELAPFPGASGAVRLAGTVTCAGASPCEVAYQGHYSRLGSPAR